MDSPCVPKATLGRLPEYLRYLKTISGEYETVSSTAIAKAMGLGEVQVRKDLAAVSGKGRPKIGYNKSELEEQLEKCLGQKNRRKVVLVGAGKLGSTLLGYEGFNEYGLSIVAAFDISVHKKTSTDNQKPIYPLEYLESYCTENNIKIGIIAVPKSAAQMVCDMLTSSGITSVWSFAQATLKVPEGVNLRRENLALSLAHISQKETN